MRQAGIIAAAGITALEEMVDRIEEDHKNAQRLAEGISQIEGLSIEPTKVQTNIVYFEVIGERITAGKLVGELDKRGVKILLVGSARLRVVTHYGITAEDIDSVLKTLREVTEGM